MTSRSNLALVRRAYAALEANDMDVFMGLLADDVVVDYPVHEELPYGGRWHGRIGARQFFDEHDRTEELIDFQVDRLSGDGDAVVALGRFKGRSVRSGRVWSTHFAHAFEIDAGRISRWTSYFDTGAALDAHRDLVVAGDLQAPPGSDDAAVAGLSLAMGAACTIFDELGRILLVRHTYGRLNWELPGGRSEAGEAPADTAVREVREETGLDVELERLTGAYYETGPQPGHDHGPIIHFVFRARSSDDRLPAAMPPEIGAVGYWPLDALPTPISDFTERRIVDAAAGGDAIVARIEPRTWRE